VSWYDLNPHLEQPFHPYAKELHSVDTLDFDELADWVLALSRRFYIVDGLFDQWHAISFQQDLEKMGLKQIEGKQLTRDETSRQFDAFKTLMYHGRLLLYDYTVRDVIEEEEDTLHSALDEGTGHIKHAPYIKELLELRAERKSKKITLVEAPNGPHKFDDFSDALVRSVWLTLHRVGNPKYIAGTGGTRDVAEQMGATRQRALSSTEYQRRKSRSRNYRGKRGGALQPWRRK